MNQPTHLKNTDLIKLGNVYTHPVHRTILFLIYLTGMKIGESLELMVDDVYDENNVVKSQIELKTRTIPVCPTLKRYLEVYNHPLAGYLFPSKNSDGHISYESVLKYLQSKSRLIGIKQNVTTHSIRVCCLSELARLTDTQTVQKISGIASLQNLQQYLQTDGDRTLCALDSLLNPANV